MRWAAIVSLLMLTACAAEPEAEAQVNHTEKASSVSQSKAFEEHPLYDSYKLFEERYLRVKVGEGYFDHNYDLEPLGDSIRVIQPGNREILRQSAIRELPNRLECRGVAKQGGMAICKTDPNAKVDVGRSEDDIYVQTADENGMVIVGFDRDEPPAFIQVGEARIDFEMPSREYDTSRIDGLPPSQVSTFSEAQLKRIRSSSARKKVGFSSRAKAMGFKNGFDLPIKAEFIKTTNFGAQRILNGEPKKPHYGVDLAAPVGTPIYAPADGIVSLADDDLYFEGAMVLLDHGQGLISMYLHTDEILVEPGQAVKQGEQIATVGSKGRSTGAHLCWRLKWRNRNLDPELLTEWPQEG